MSNARGVLTRKPVVTNVFSSQTNSPVSFVSTFFFPNLSVKLNFCLHFDSKEKLEVLVSIGYNIGDPLELATAVRYSVWLSQYLIKFFAIIAMRKDPDIATKYCQISVQMTNTGGCFIFLLSEGYFKMCRTTFRTKLSKQCLNTKSLKYIFLAFSSIIVNIFQITIHVNELK